MIVRICICFLMLANLANAAVWYVDCIAAGARNGTSWANAWTNFSELTNTITAGDYVFISGGPANTTQTYPVYTSTWPNGNGYPYDGGVSGPAVVYQIGQDASHNGTAIFDGGGHNNLVYTFSGNGYFTFSGHVTNDTIQHFAFTNYAAESFVVPLPGVTLSYCNFGTIAANSACVTSSGCTRFDMDNCYAYGTGNDADHLLKFTFNDSAYDSSIISNCVFYTPHGANATYGSGDGEDLLQIGGDGLTFINNKCYSYDNPNESGASQHDDAWQGQSAANMKIIGNVFNDFGNSSVFLDVTSTAGFTNVIIANNICSVKSQWMVNGDGILLLTQNGSGASPFVNVAVFNNTCVDYNIASVSAHGMNVGHNGNTGIWTAVLVENNIYINSVVVFHPPDTNPVTNIDNVSLTSAQATNFFVLYNKAGANNNYNLNVTAASLIGQGQNLSSYVTTDIAGTARSATNNWDIGAYAYSGPLGAGIPVPAQFLMQ